jgi:hypothetical protein
MYLICAWIVILFIKSCVTLDEERFSGTGPDTFKQLEKFRRVQSHVRASKSKFDRHKLACLQKIDLLAAARCNMFSHGLIVYQDNMATFWKRTSSAMTTVSEAYKGVSILQFVLFQIS